MEMENGDGDKERGIFTPLNRREREQEREIIKEREQEREIIKERERNIYKERT